MACVLFVCVANSARSQLAEAIARHLDPEVEWLSAGSRPTHVRPEVPRVLEERGLDARGLRSKGFDELPLEEVDLAVLLCEDDCPLLPAGLPRLAWPLPDPACAPDDERLEAFRATRDELLRRLPGLRSEAGLDR